MGLSQQYGDLHVTGTLTAGNNVPSAGAVGNAQVSATAAIVATKLQQQHVFNWSQGGIDTDAFAETKYIHTVYGATATVVDFQAGAAVAAGAATTVTVDLQVNGSTILSSVISITSADTANTMESPSGYSSTSLVADDRITVVITVTGTNEPQGVYGRLVLREDPAP